MCVGNLKAAGLAISVVLAALAVSACGSGEEATTTQPPPLSAATADQLAKLSERVADELDAGNTCHAAHTADDLSSAVGEANLAASLRPAVEEVTTQLVDEVNCPPPPPPPEPEKKKKDEKKQDEHKGDQGGDQNSGPGHSGGVPPGQAKLKGEG